MILCTLNEHMLKIPIFVFLFLNSHIFNIIIMRRLRLLQILITLILTIAQLVNPAEAQMPQRGGNQVAVTGWADDTHYLIRNFDSDKKLVLQSVDIKSGKSVVVPQPKSEREIISESLPPGTVLSNCRCDKS